MRTDISIEELLAQEDWNAERKALRDILLDSGLEETVKWGQLCYMAHGSNVALIFALKDTVGIGFLKGALLDDPEGELVLPGPNSKSALRMDFTSLDEIRRRENRLRSFIAEAVENEKQGRTVERDESQMPEWPQELHDAFGEDVDLRAAFEGLTPRRQRGYLIHFNEGKQADTRARRIAKHAPRILAGKGMHDR